MQLQEKCGAGAEWVVSPVLLLGALCHTASRLRQACLAAVSSSGLMPRVPSKIQVWLAAAQRQVT